MRAPGNKKIGRKGPVSVVVSASVSNCDAELVPVNSLGRWLRCQDPNIGRKSLGDASSGKRHTCGGGISPYRAASYAHSGAQAP